MNIDFLRFCQNFLNARAAIPLNAVCLFEFPKQSFLELLSVFLYLLCLNFFRFCFCPFNYRFDSNHQNGMLFFWTGLQLVLVIICLIFFLYVVIFLTFCGEVHFKFFWSSTTAWRSYFLYLKPDLWPLLNRVDGHTILCSRNLTLCRWFCRYKIAYYSISIK